MTATLSGDEWVRAARLWKFCYGRERRCWRMLERCGSEAGGRVWQGRLSKWNCLRLRVQARDWRLVPREERGVE
jgi:hypothetical protein